MCCLEGSDIIALPLLIKKYYVNGTLGQHKIFILLKFCLKRSFTKPLQSDLERVFGLLCLVFVLKARFSLCTMPRFSTECLCKQQCFAKHNVALQASMYKTNLFILPSITDSRTHIQPSLQNVVWMGTLLKVWIIYSSLSFVHIHFDVKQASRTRR